MIGPWVRIEGSTHDDELDAGVEARVADPLWMLARQWQVGEFRGDDASSPIAAQLTWSATTLTTYRPRENGPVTPMPQAQPLERVVEAAPPPSGGAARLNWSARLAAQVARRLIRNELAEVIDQLRTGFPLQNGSAVALPGAGTSAAVLLRARSFDGAALLAASETRTDAALAGLDNTVRSSASSIIRRWRESANRSFSTPPIDTWDDERLEHRFSVAAGAGEAEIVLAATAYTGGHLDWFSFDIDATANHGAGNKPPKGDKPPAPRGTVTAIPTPVRYAGMPAPRWWAFEDGDVHLGDIAAAPGDLGRLLLADYATVYNDDWFSVPLRLPLGTLSRVDRLRVHDTMGGHLEIRAAALSDDRTGKRRVFRLYELTDDPSTSAKVAPLLFLPPSLAGSDSGPILEQVEFVRDEAANLAWGIERLVEGPMGRAVDRLQHWRTTSAPTATTRSAKPGSKTDDGRPTDRPARTGPNPKPADGIDIPDGFPGPDIDLPGDGPIGQGGEPTGGSDRETWRYRLESTAPPYWIPFIPTRIGSGAQVKLRRARMQEWELLDHELVGPKGELLQSDQRMVIEEEEVPRSGLSLDRCWQLARWTDGSVHVWLQRSKQLGYGERSSGVRWDILEDLEP